MKNETGRHTRSFFASPRHQRVAGDGSLRCALHTLYSGAIDRWNSSRRPFGTIHPSRKQLAPVIHQRGGKGGKLTANRDTAPWSDPGDGAGRIAAAHFNPWNFLVNTTAETLTRLRCPANFNLQRVKYFRFPQVAIALSQHDQQPGSGRSSWNWVRTDVHKRARTHTHNIHTFRDSLARDELPSEVGDEQSVKRFRSSCRSNEQR